MLIMDGTLSDEFLARLLPFTCYIGSLEEHLHISRLELGAEGARGLSKSKRKADLL
jgi:hypothetical protein